MLAQHLSQEHDRASRRGEAIDRQVEFIRRTALPKSRGRVLDLGCGPGLYCHRLTALGHDCLGIDFGPASVEYAREEAARRSLACRFELGDIRSVEFGGGFDLVMLLYGELNPFPREEAVALLRRWREALAPGGIVLLEAHSFEAVRSRGEAAPAWSAAEAGLFSERPHLRLDESFWLDAEGCAAGRHWLIDAETAEVTLYGWSMLAYTEEGYRSLLGEAGLSLQATYPSLSGEEDGKGFPVLLVRAGG
jgi:SAM-dependent methyltransferase